MPKALPAAGGRVDCPSMLRPMRGILDFYRRNPFVLAVAVIVGAGVSALAASGGSGGIIGDVAAVAVAGLLVGLLIAWRRSRNAP